MWYDYNTENTCAQMISFDIEGDAVTKISFPGGCNGNLETIVKPADGWIVEKPKICRWATPAADVPPPAPTSWQKPSGQQLQNKTNCAKLNSIICHKEGTPWISTIF